jgi:methionyl-tRNA formyltransferase
VKVVVPAARAYPGGCAGAGAPAPGEVDGDDNGVFLGAADGVLELGEVRPAGRVTMPATDWWRGARLGGATALDAPVTGGAPGS